MLSKVFEKILHEDEELVNKEEALSSNKNPSKPLPKKILFLSFAIFIVALSVRLYSLFYITQPQNAGVEGWYSDTYHHWQIAYLTKEIGLHQGFLRLWDLKGMEYFWGLAHPLTGVLIMTLTGSTDIVNFRLLSVFSGSFSIVFLFLIVKRYWNFSAALSAALIAIFNPVGIFSDASGMIEPLGILFMLSAIYFYTKYPFLSGFLFVFAAMTRAEYWVLGGFILIGLLVIKHRRGIVPLILSYTFAILLYMKYLLDNTENPIYPVWWNYLGNAVGQWQADIAPTIIQSQIQKVYWIIAAVSFVGIILTFWKKPKATPFLLFGLGNWFMWGVVIGMTKYLLSYLPRFWVDRIMLWPYMFLGALIPILVFGLINKLKFEKIRKSLSAIAWIIIVLIIFASQSLWTPIHFYYDPTIKYWNNLMTIAEQYEKFDSGEGKILVSEDWPPLLYMMVNYKGLKGSRVVGQMFDPFYYMDSKPFDNWGENREIITRWLKNEDITLIFFPKGKDRYEKLIEKEPDMFTFLDDSVGGVSFYRVNQDKLELQ